MEEIKSYVMEIGHGIDRTLGDGTFDGDFNLIQQSRHHACQYIGAY